MAAMVVMVGVRLWLESVLGQVRCPGEGRMSYIAPR